MADPKHRPPEEVVSGSSAEHLLPRPEQEREQRSGGWEGPVAAPSAPNLPPLQTTTSGAPASLSSLGQGFQGLSGERARAGWSGRGMAQCGPGGSGLGGHSQARRPGVGQSRGFPLGWGDPTGFSVSQESGHRDLLSQTWASRCRATWSLGAPWLSVGSGRHL